MSSSPDEYSLSAQDKHSVPTPLFPAYATSATSNVSPESNKVGNEWLTNKSFIPDTLPCLPLHEGNEGKRSEPQKENENSAINEIKHAEEQCTAFDVYDDQKVTLLGTHSYKTKQKHKKHKKRKLLSRSPQKLAEDEERDSDSLYKAMSKMVFIEETGLAVEHAFYVDPKPDKQNFAFPTFYHKHTALYNKLNIPTLGTLVTKDKQKKSSSSSHDRYWHKKNSVFLYKPELLNLSKPLLDSHYKASNYIPLELSESELKNTVSKTLDNSICDNASEFCQQSKFLNEEDSAEEPTRSSEEHYIYLKTQEYNKILRENPLDEEKWLDFVAFQDEVMNVSDHDRNKKAANKIKETGFLEKKIAILEKSLVNNPGSVRLAVAKLQLLQEFGEIDEVMKEWKNLVFLHPNDTSLWQQYIFFVQSHLSYFTVSRTCKLYIKCIATLNKILSGTFQTHLPSPDLEDRMLDIFFQYCSFLHQCGYVEKALATFQALIEFNMFQPGAININSSKENLLTFFEPFWDSGAPRFGEDGALGWERILAEKKLIPAQVQKSKDVNLKEDEIISKAVTKAQAWLEFETLREQHYWLPWRPDIKASSEEDCEDPERSILIDDVSEVLFLLKSERTKILAIFHFLRFLGVEFWENNRMSCWCSDDYCNQYIVEVPSDIHPFLVGTRDSYLDESKEILNLPLLASRHRFIPFIEKVFEQAIKLFSPQYSKFLCICWVQFKINLLQKCGTDKEHKRELKNAKKLTKSLLKEEINRNNLDLWKEYGRLEHLHSNLEDVEKVFQTALLTYPDKIINQNDIWDFVKTYVELQLGINSVKSFGMPFAVNSLAQNKARALWMLCFLGSGDHYEPNLLMSSQIPATKILKARNGFQKFVIQQEGGNFDTGNILKRPKTLLVISTVCFAYFQYLTQGMHSAADVYEDAIKKLNNSNIDHKAYCRLEMESIFASYLQLFVLHSSNTVVPLKSFRSVLVRALREFPQNSYFLWLFLDLETGSGIANHFRKYFNRVLMKESTASLTEWLFAVVAELKYHEKLQAAMQAMTIPDTGITWKIRSLFERALKLPKLCHSTLLWRMYIKFEANQSDKERAKAVFYEALRHCPWSKVLYVDGIKYFPNDVQEIMDIMVEKGLRIRTPMEEVQLLLEHAGVIVEKEPVEASSPDNSNAPTEMNM